MLNCVVVSSLCDIVNISVGESVDIKSLKCEVVFDVAVVGMISTWDDADAVKISLTVESVPNLVDDMDVVVCVVVMSGGYDVGADEIPPIVNSVFDAVCESDVEIGAVWDVMTIESSVIGIKDEDDFGTYPVNILGLF